MGKDNRRFNRDENDYDDLKRLEQALRGATKKRDKTTKPKREKSLRDVANDYNRSGELEDED